MLVWVSLVFKALKLKDFFTRFLKKHYKEKMQSMLLLPSSVWSSDMMTDSFRTHMQDLQEVTQDLHYENFRSERLKKAGRWDSAYYSILGGLCIREGWSVIPVCFPCRAVDEDVMDKDQILLQKELEVRTRSHNDIIETLFPLFPWFYFKSQPSYDLYLQISQLKKRKIYFFPHKGTRLGVSCHWAITCFLADFGRRVLSRLHV